MQGAYGHYSGLRAYGAEPYSQEALDKLSVDTWAALKSATSAARAAGNDAAAHALNIHAKEYAKATNIPVLKQYETFFVAGSIVGGVLIVTLLAFALSGKRPKAASGSAA